MACAQAFEIQKRILRTENSEIKGGTDVDVLRRAVREVEIGLSLELKEKCLHFDVYCVKIAALIL